MGRSKSDRRCQGEGRRSKPDLVLKEASKAKANAAHNRQVEEATKMNQKLAPRKSGPAPKQQEGSTNLKRARENQNKAAAGSGQRVMKSLKKSAETGLKGSQVVLQPRIEVSSQTSRRVAQDNMGIKIEPVPASETDSSDSQVVQPKVGNKVTIIDEDYSYESYYSESATAQARQTGAPQNASEPSMVESQCGYVSPECAARPSVKPEEDSRAGANYMVCYHGGLRACLSWMHQHITEHGFHTTMSMMGLISAVVLQVIAGLRRADGCEPGTRVAIQLQRTYMWLRRAIKGARKMARQSYTGGHLCCFVRC